MRTVESSIPFLDGHNDTLLRIHSDAAANAQAFLERGERAQLDLPRARAGGFAGGFFAVFVPDPETERMSRTKAPAPPYARPLDAEIDSEHAAREADAMTELLFEIERAGGLRVARTVADVERALEQEEVAAILHFEGAEPIDAELTALEEWYERGLRSLGPVWSRPNAFAEGVPFAFPGSPDTGPGLTAAGRRLVGECNRLGIMLDLSHLNERGFWDVAELSDAPLVATHSNAHALCASTRNLTDAQLDAIAASNGLVGATFHAGMLRADGYVDPATPLDALLDHVDHLVERLGIDGVAFGSDFDGAIVIEAIGDAAGLPAVTEGLRGRGYDEPSIRKLAHENWLRILRATWRA